MNRADWRRQNVNTFVAETQARVKRRGTHVQFGISPFGVWRNRAQDPVLGSDTRASVSSYDDLYGDALHWARTGTVDYLLPQLYWSLDFAAAGHRTLADWWARNTPPTTQLYVGHAAYKVNNNADEAWTGLEELPRQIALARNTPRLEGSVYFSARSILGNRDGLPERIGREYGELALLPERPTNEPAKNLKVKVFKPKAQDEGTLLVWEVNKKTPAADLPWYYAIYRVTNGTPTLLHRTPYGMTCHRLNYVDREMAGRKRKDYVVVPMDRFHRAMVGDPHP